MSRIPAALAAPADPPLATILPVRQTLAGMVLDALRERIVRGIYPEGEPLRQDAIALELGVSRIPVREAFRQLEAEGLVTLVPHRGAVVSSLSLEEIDEIFSLRSEIEADLLRRAIPQLTAEELRRAGATLDGWDDAVADGDVAAWGTMNWEFHSALYGPAQRPVTMAIAQRLHQQSDRYLRLQITLTHGELRASKEHRAILAAVRRRDVRRATTLLKEHIVGAGRQLLDFLREQRSRPAIARTPRVAGSKP